MELITGLWLCVGSICIIFSWKCLTGICYAFKWLTIYSILKWNRYKSNKPEIPFFTSKREEYLEKPRVWTEQKPFQRDSMLVFAGGQDVWMLMEVARGCHNSAVACLTLHLGSDKDIYETPEVSSPSACDGWTTPCLAMECLEPMRRWRIVFTGRLQHRKNNGHIESRLVKLNLIWVSLCGPYQYTTDADLYSLVSLLAAQPLTHLRHNLDSLGKGYEQWGTVQGMVCVEGVAGSTVIHSPSLRRHSWKWPHANARVSLVGLVDNGSLFSINYSYSNIRSQLGHMRYSDGRIETIEGISTTENNYIREKFIRNFSSSFSNHLAYFVCSPWSMWGGFKWSSARCVLDTDPAVCLVLSWDRKMREDLPLLPLLRWTEDESDVLALALHQPTCSNPSVVGGKAASLALLTGASFSTLKHKVVVPEGFCLTVHAMKLQAQSSQSLISAVKYLTMVSPELSSTDLLQECQHVESAWLSVPMCSAVAAILAERVVDDCSYAVRSSAASEDRADVSAAGQNTTVLGCVGLDNVLTAVLRCWASLYSYQSVQYRRQAGLPVESLMGVVVQKMVPAETAGVMFTRHPVTADPHQLLITANYGLGETVVSGTVDPDTIIVSTEDPNNLKVESVVQGRKDRQLAITGEGGVQEQCLGPELRESVCLTKPEMIALAKVGHCLEQLFGWPRDVEWALNKGVIYLLQCRPITTLFTWTQEELTHELDSALMPSDATTTANIGEVLPGASSPLCQSTTLRCANFHMIHQIAGVRHSMWYNNSKIVTSRHCALLNLYTTLLCHCEKEPTLQQKALELAICGHRVSTTELQNAAARRTTALNLVQKIKFGLHFLKHMIMSTSETKKAQKIGEEFKINYDSDTTPAALYAHLTSSYWHLLAVFKHHNRVTMASTLWQTVLFSILAEGKKELSVENIEDIAILLVGNEKALTVQIPSDIKELAKLIKRSDKWEEVTVIPPEKVQGWLKKHNPPAFSFLTDMLHRYQHRCTKELDVMSKTWALDCSPLVVAVQSALKYENLAVAHSEKRAPQDQLMDQLKSPLKPFSRWLLRNLLGTIRSEAARREATKDASLKVVHQTRLAFLRLAHLMTAEGRLPSSQLIWYCTFYELGQLVIGPNPTLLHKIARRQQSWHQWDQQRFAEVMVGLPTPLKAESHLLVEKESYVEGTLVCGGSVTGRACVLLSCIDSQILRTGDILVTHSTDVGWTPLFPLLAGVITELGGLISHGAVVAREYGLPCIVGATNATAIIKTGDMLFLDGQTGKVQKISSTC